MDVLRTYFTPSSRLGGPAAPRGKAAQDAASISPVRLLPLFGVWKTILVLTACLSPGSGYDTSTRIYIDGHHSPSSSWLATALDHLVLRLTRWDAIYFTSAAEHGKHYEQEWAFSLVLSNFTSLVVKGVYRAKHLPGYAHQAKYLPCQFCSGPSPSPPSSSTPSRELPSRSSRISLPFWFFTDLYTSSYRPHLRANVSLPTPPPLSTSSPQPASSCAPRLGKVHSP